MKRILAVSVAAMIVAGSVAAYGRELNRRVHPKGAQNVVDGTGETLDFQLTAEGAEDGSVLVKVVIPSGSELQKTSYLRLEIVKDGQILLWSKLATRKGKDGAMRTGFQIHDSLAKHAFVGFAYDAGAKDRTMATYQVPVAEYITGREAARSREGGRFALSRPEFSLLTSPADPPDLPEVFRSGHSNRL